LLLEKLILDQIITILPRTDFPNFFYLSRSVIKQDSREALN